MDASKKLTNGKEERMGGQNAVFSTAQQLLAEPGVQSARKNRRTEGEKNVLWQLYREADGLVRDEIQLELKKADLFRTWQQTASLAGYNLFYAPGPLRDIFLKLLPESKPLFEKNATPQPIEP